MNVTPRPAATCHPERPHKARGRCARCYAADRYRANPEKGRAQANRWYRANPAKAQAGSRRRNLRQYGLTEEAFRGLAQHGCAICLRTSNLCVDHCHRTGRVRGVLCRVCNTLLGFVDDDITRLARAISYLVKGAT